MLHITIVNINLVGTNKQEMGLSIKWTYFLIGLDKIVMIEFKSILLSALNWNNVVWALYVSINSIQVKVGSGNNNVVNSSDLQPTPLGCLETNKLFSWWWDDDCGLALVPRVFVMMSPASAPLMPASPATNDKVIPSSANNCWHETPSCSVTSHQSQSPEHGPDKTTWQPGNDISMIGAQQDLVTISAMLTTCHPCSMQLASLASSPGVMITHNRFLPEPRPSRN